MSIYYIAALIGVFLTAIAQLILKKGALAGMKKKGFWQAYFNIYSLLGYGLFVVVTLFNLFALKKVELKDMTFILPITFVLVPLLSVLIFKEKLTKQQVWGIVLIAVGIFVFNLEHFFT